MPAVAMLTRVRGGCASLLAILICALAPGGARAAEVAGAFGFTRANTPVITGNASSSIVLGSGMLFDSAVVSGRVTPDASTITFRLYGPNDPSCSGVALADSTVAYPSMSSPAVESPAFQPTQAGTYRWRAFYNGDAGNDPVATACGDPAQTTSVAKAVPVLEATATPGAGTAGVTPLTDVASVTGRVNPQATATIDFRLYGPADPSCDLAPIHVSLGHPYPIAAGGAFVTSSPFTPAVPGTYRWVATYSGDANNVALASPCGSANEAVVTSGPVVVADSDNDGVADSADNCPAAPNPSQADADGDRIGDACDPPPPPPPPADRDADGVPDATDNCPDAANAKQFDADADAVGDACESLPSGTVAPVAGVNAVVKVLAGEVFVKLPGAASVRGQARRAAEGDAPGFIPLKGNASVPVGSTVDTRSGRVSVSTSAEFPGQPRRTQSGTFAAGIFQIKQARKRQSRSSPRKPTTDINLVTPRGAIAACARGLSRSSANGIVRSLSAVLKGRYRTLGAVGFATVTDATLVVKDRCDGTITQVGRGLAKVYDRGRRITVKVRAGRSYLARGRTFDNPLKGRP